MVKPVFLILMGAIALLSGCTASLPGGQKDPSVTQTASTTTAPFSYDRYETVLRTYVNEAGFVNYAALQANPQPLKEFIAMVGAVSPNTYDAWNEPEKMAFLINAYNAITLESIIDQHPIKGSIKDIVGVWNFHQHRVMGRSLTLDAIEHDMLRKNFQEPRIHAALVCAAISCPPLRQEPYTGANLDTQLTEQVQRWLSSPRGLQIDRTRHQVSISSIFDWFGQDWQAAYGTDTAFTGNAKERAVLNFISHYVSSDDQNYLKQGDYKLHYLPYDWSLNRQ